VRRDSSAQRFPARGDRIACKQLCTPFAPGNAQIVRALDEQAVGVDKHVLVRLRIEQRVPGVRVAMRQNRICRIEGISSGFGEPQRSLDDPFRAGSPEPQPNR
jgi:hypothetical protein